MSPDTGRPGRSRAKGAKSLSSWRGGPWDTPKTQQTTGQGYHRGTRFQASRAGNLLTALTVVGPVGCRTGRAQGPEKLALRTERWTELAGSAIFAHAGNLSVGGVFLLQKRALSLARRRPGACISSPCPRDFERACRSTAPCRWHRAIEWRRRRGSGGG